MTANDLHMPKIEIRGVKAVKDTFLISHNIWCYVYGLQKANWNFDRGNRPSNLSNCLTTIETLIDQIILNADNDKSLALITLHKNALDL